jgi:outer membrane protein assembly factor BamA
VHPQGSPKNDFEKYGYKGQSLSSGLSFHLLRDTRDNPINAYSGTFASIAVNPRLKFLGSDASWTTMVLEWRGYYRFPAGSSNTLALWNFNWFTLGGKPPYLMLPATAWDKSYSTGRGYIQGRFRSNNMIDAEAEYRIRLTKNGLLGMVLFGNLQSFSEIDSWRFETAAPAGGLGLRIKLNKYSRTNISIDYGWGRQGSRGFFVNLGEVF